MTILLQRCDNKIIYYAFYALRYIYNTAREVKKKHQSTENYLDVIARVRIFV